MLPAPANLWRPWKPAASAWLVPPPDAATQFALGTLDAMTGVLSALVGCGVLSADLLIQDQTRRRDLLAQEQGPIRAMPSALLVERLVAIRRVVAELPCRLTPAADVSELRQ